MVLARRLAKMTTVEVTMGQGRRRRCLELVAGLVAAVEYRSRHLPDTTEHDSTTSKYQAISHLLLKSWAPTDMGKRGQRFGVAVTRWSRSTQLLYIEPG